MRHTSYFKRCPVGPLCLSNQAPRRGQLLIFKTSSHKAPARSAPASQGERTYPASSPKQVDFISLESLVRTDKGHPLDLGLGGQYPVEGVAMMERQSLDRRRVPPVHRQGKESILPTVFHKRPQAFRQIQFPQGGFDGHFPNTRRADMEFRPGLFEGGPDFGGKAAVPSRKPEDDLGVEEKFQSV